MPLTESRLKPIMGKYYKKYDLLYQELLEQILSISPPVSSNHPLLF